MSDRRKGGLKGHNRQVLTRFEQDLRRAKNQGLTCRFSLATECIWADDDCIVVGTIMEVEGNDIKIRNSKGDEFWLNKNLVVGTEVQE